MHETETSVHQFRGFYSNQAFPSFMVWDTELDFLSIFSFYIII